MPTEQYLEFIKRMDGSWKKQHPETDAEQVTEVFPTMRFSLGETKYLSPTTNIPLTKAENIIGDKSFGEIAGERIKINRTGLFLITPSLWIEQVPNQTTIVQLLLEAGNFDIGSTNVSRWSDKAVVTYTTLQKLKTGQKIYLHTDNEYAIANPSYKAIFPANKISVTLMLLKGE